MRWSYGDFMLYGETIFISLFLLVPFSPVASVSRHPQLRVISLPSSFPATGIVMYVYSIRRMLEDSPALSGTIDKWWEITMGFTIFLNVLTPGLIIGRLW